MTLKRSDDDGDSWQKAALLWAGKAAYSVVVPLGLQEVGVMYERGDNSAYEKVTLAVIQVKKV
jgi:sialidase-1